jgi:hypothetical protein
MIRNWGIWDSDLYKERLPNGRYTDEVILRKGYVHPCTGTEALYRPYGL